MRDRSHLIANLLSGRPSRESYIRAKLNVLIPSQIRGLRLKRPLTQTELADSADMKQSRISAMERPGQVQFNLETLIRLAAALRVALKVEFVSFSDMLAWENSFSQDRFRVLRIDEDASFLTPAQATSAAMLPIQLVQASVIDTNVAQMDQLTWLQGSVSGFNFHMDMPSGYATAGVSQPKAPAGEGIGQDKMSDEKPNPNAGRQFAPGTIPAGKIATTELRAGGF